MYTLILTIALAGHHPYNPSVAVEHIPGFESEAACLTAGNAWLKGAIPAWSSHRAASANCVRMK